MSIALIVASLTSIALGQDPPAAPPPEEVAAEQPWQRNGWGFGGVPALNYNTDEGFGFGVLASFYRYNGRTKPYKSATTVLVFFTTKQVMSHRIDLDMLEVGDLPLRLTSRVALSVSRTANFCGYGHEVTCDPQVAEDEADAQGLGGDEREDFLRRYYLLRYLRPYARIYARYQVHDAPKTEILFGVRAERFISGDFTENTAFPGSLYDEAIPGGESGWLTVFETGVMVDTRDNEPAPRRGMWHEATVRGSPGLLSDFPYGGFNTTFRFYAPVLPEGKLTLASRTILDGWEGQQHVKEYAAAGGSQLVDLGGGEQAGRGIRLRRYIGKAKAVQQFELRWAFAKAQLASQEFEFTLIGYADGVLAAAEWSDLGAALAEPKVGFGPGFRLAWEQNFIIRLDLGFSPVEDYGMGFYLNVDNLF